ncbi:FUSC family protein [Mycobacteroides franklinii]|uniref:Fusaric acid resistance protein family protein n=1 Tax=Mycobacteroides franklinii TaxID=948102 RepID=A0A4R8RDP1_9MYCO|nr:FUSC family protein [Mycobacteroides franklinii]TDZ42790.1 Fusaric acid resistance protein family protein [Mycobacteroides franklinii]TDZ52938.1 Fusaric acid resistance protein family protein [Mycobacteroides franklinii]TDZ56345.1 Fusaric acid resistance protein family protein [Mycobacteroides franklinii]TDZ63286.1 Fusaric acid resistance protein family protein [Mycobacteroides franklinii]TDZ69683.1 Fusaric acid resistance protein family protein [Mycobacteroides franklinii]
MTPPAPESPDPLPQIARARSILFSAPPAGRRWSIGLRAGAAVAIPGTLVVAAGYPNAALYVTYGAFAVLYGEGRPYRVRAAVVATAGIALMLVATVGAIVGTYAPGGVANKAATILALTAVAVPVVYTVDALRLGPPGALFFVLVCGGALGATEWGVAPEWILICAGLGAIAAVIVSMAGAAIDRHKPERVATQRAVDAVDIYAQPGNASVDARHAAGAAISSAWTALHDAGLSNRSDSPLVNTMLDTHRRFTEIAVGNKMVLDHLIPGDHVLVVRPSIWYRLRRSVRFRSHATITAGRVGIACLGAGVISAAVGLARPQWAILSALVIVHMGPDRLHGTVRGLHRFAGTVIGLGLFAVLYQLSPTGYTLIAAIATLQFCAELFLPRNYAVAVMFVTPIALLSAGVVTLQGSVTSIVRDRLAETMIGVAVAMASIYLIAPRAHRRTFAFTEARIRKAALALVAAARIQPAHDAAYAEARDLSFELEGAIRAGVDSAHNEPDWLQSYWPAHAALIHHGYDLVAACWATPPGEMLADPDRWERCFSSNA